jgi:hypothetical protein
VDSSTETLPEVLVNLSEFLTYLNRFGATRDLATGLGRTIETRRRTQQLAPLPVRAPNARRGA